MTVRTLAEAAAEILSRSKAANINEKADYQELGGSSFENPEGTANLGAAAAAAVATNTPPGAPPAPASKDALKKLGAQLPNSVSAKANPPAGTDSGKPTATAGNPVATYEEADIDLDSLTEEELDDYLDSLTEEELDDYLDSLTEEQLDEISSDTYWAAGHLAAAKADDANTPKLKNLYRKMARRFHYAGARQQARDDARTDGSSEAQIRKAGLYKSSHDRANQIEIDETAMTGKEEQQTRAEIKQHQRDLKKAGEDPGKKDYHSKWIAKLQARLDNRYKDIKEEEEVTEELTEEEIAQIELERKQELVERAKKKMAEVSCKEDIDALFNGEDLSEDFREKVTTIFESAVIARAVMVVEEMEEEILQAAEQTVEEIKSELEEQVDSYLNYMAEEWIQENKLAVESGIKSEIQESFINGLKNLFVEHYIDVPDEQFDMVDAMSSEIDQLNDKLNEALNTNIELAKAITEARKTELQATVCEGLTATQAAKVKTLAEGVEFTTEGEYTKKLNIIRENYFAGDNSSKVKQTNPVALVESEGPVEINEVSSAMDVYMRAISRTLPK